MSGKSSYKDFKLKSKDDKSLTFTQYKEQNRNIRETSKPKMEKQISETPQPKMEKQISKTPQPKFVGHVERPSVKDYEGGFERRTATEDVDEKYQTYNQGGIDQYLRKLSEKMDDEYSWRIAADICYLNIYDKNDKLVKSKRLIHIRGDSYYVVFDELATEKVKAHKAIAFVDWFM